MSERRSSSKCELGSLQVCDAISETPGSLSNKGIFESKQVLNVNHLQCLCYSPAPNKTTARCNLTVLSLTTSKHKADAPPAASHAVASELWPLLDMLLKSTTSTRRTKGVFLKLASVVPYL